MTAVYLEESPSGAAMAFAPDIPGSYGWGPNRGQAMDILAADIAWTSRWLQDHGLKRSTHGPLTIIETVPAMGTASSYDSEGFFSWDAQVYTEQDLEETKEIIGWSRSGLINYLKNLPQPCWHISPLPGKQTVAEVVEHIAIAEWWYTTRVPGANPLRVNWQDYPADPLDKLIAIRADVEHYLMGMKDIDLSQRAAVFIKNRETWSGRKVLRRMVWHELHHYKQLLKYNI